MYVEHDVYILYNIHVNVYMPKAYKEDFFKNIIKPIEFYVAFL